MTYTRIDVDRLEQQARNCEQQARLWDAAGMTDTMADNLRAQAKGYRAAIAQQFTDEDAMQAMEQDDRDPIGTFRGLVFAVKVCAPFWLILAAVLIWLAVRK